MGLLPRQRKRSFLTAIFFVAVCSSIPSAISFQSSQLFDCRRNTGNPDLTGDTRNCRVFRSSSNNINDENDINYIEEISNASSPSSGNNDMGDCSNRKRRDFLLSTSSSCLALTGVFQSDAAQAINIFKKKGLYVLNSKNAVSASSMRNEQVEVFPKLSTEYALLRVLPVKNPVFRTIEQNLEALSVLRYRRDASQESIDKAWAKAEPSIDTAISILANKRIQLEPIFNPDDSTEVAIRKAERGEILLGDLTEDLEYLKESIGSKVCSKVHRM